MKMKGNLLKILALVFIATPLFAACSDSDDDDKEKVIAYTELPETIKTLVAANFGDATATRVIKKNKAEADGTLYEVSLSNGFEIDFDAEGNWTEIESDNKEIPTELIPLSISTYVTENYPAIFITGIDKEANGYHVDLSNDVDLEFDKDGNFVRVDN